MSQHQRLLAHARPRVTRQRRWRRCARYLPFGPIDRITYGNGRIQSRSYDGNYAIAQISSSGADGLALDFAVDAVGNLTQVSAGSAGNQLAYDGIDRLTEVKQLNNDLIEAFAYDATGNRITHNQAGTSVPYSYAANSHRLTAVGSTPRSVDATGNTTAIGSNTLSYDARNRLSAATVAGQTVSYQYNARGERVSKAGTATTVFAYDEAGHLLGEYASGGSVNAEYLWLGDLPIAIRHADDNIAYIEPDHLGTPRAVIDPTRDLAIWQWPLLDNAFGAAAPITDPDGDGVTFTLNLRFPGQYFDGETGLHYNYFRDYDPGTGRYVESDPIGLGDSPSTYSYVRTSPLMGVDPFGLTSLWFNARTKTLTVVPTVGSPYWISASSGRPGCDECTSRDKGRGQIPSGRYRLNSYELSDPSFVGDIARNFRPGGGDWGDWRVRLWPEPGTETFNRDGFFLHGGSIPGSAGCIDIGGGIFGGSQSGRLKQDIVSDPDGVVDVHVR